MAQALGIRSIPTVLVFRGGKVADAIPGVNPKHRYQGALDGLIIAQP